jgi:hypothetical protein
MNTKGNYGVERGAAWANGGGSDYEIVRGFETEEDAREHLHAVGAPVVKGGYASLVELDHSGAPCRTIETIEAEVTR